MNPNFSKARKSRSDRGTAVIEAAITLVATLTFLFGLMEIGRFFQTQELLTNAAREGARLAVAPLPGTTTLPTAGEIETHVTAFLDAASVTGATVSVAGLTSAYGTVNTDLTRVRVTLPYNLITGVTWFEALEVTLVGESVMRDETSP